MVVRQFRINQANHNELREAFILLQSKGYTNEAQRLYGRLLNQVNRAPSKVLLDDFHRTLMLTDPTSPQSNNLIWIYHWTVSNELERRAPRAFARALKIADEIQ